MSLKVILVVIIAGIFAWFLVPEFKHAIIYWWIEHDYTGRTSGGEPEDPTGYITKSLSGKLNSISSKAGNGELLYKKLLRFY